MAKTIIRIVLLLLGFLTLLGATLFIVLRWDSIPAADLPIASTDRKSSPPRREWSSAGAPTPTGKAEP